MAYQDTIKRVHSNRKTPEDWYEATLTNKGHLIKYDWPRRMNEAVPDLFEAPPHLVKRAI